MTTRKKKPKAATFEQMISKPMRVATFKFRSDGDEFEIKFRAIPSKQFDDLTSDHPPTKDQKAEGLTWNVDTFFPPLIAACATEPTFTEDEVKQIIASDTWSFGELNSMFTSVLNVNTYGASASFT